MTNTSSEGAFQPIDHPEPLEEYKDLFIMTNIWGGFGDEDIEDNDLSIFVNEPAPDFVTEFERELDAKPGVAPDVRCFLDHSIDADGSIQAYRAFEIISDVQFQNEYFAPFTSGTGAVGTSFDSESRRLAGKLEVFHLMYISALEWRQSWISLKEPSMNVIFFGYFASLAGDTVRKYALTHLLLLILIYHRLCRSNQSWPFSLIMKNNKHKDEGALRQYRPCSDLLVLKSDLPRLLVEVNSKPRSEWPEDLIRMLLTGAAVVRFANSYLDKFKAAKNFVLFAIYIWDDGEVTRFSLFQKPNNREVCCWILYMTKLAG